MVITTTALKNEFQLISLNRWNIYPWKSTSAINTTKVPERVKRTVLVSLFIFKTDFSAIINKLMR
jgi:hypothetical protein